MEMIEKIWIKLSALSRSAKTHRTLGIFQGQNQPLENNSVKTLDATLDNIRKTFYKWIHAVPLYDFNITGIISFHTKARHLFIKLFVWVAGIARIGNEN
jgi:hypothetical protein